MMMQRDFDPIPVQKYADSVRQVLKRTMINQDVMFRNQVYELHRLYRVQESLMKDSSWEEHNYNLWNPKFQPSQLHFTSHFRHESLTKKTRISLNSKVASASFLARNMDFQGCIPLNLQLSADEFINHIEEDSQKERNAQNCFEGLINPDFPLSEGYSSEAEELKLSLKLGDDNGRISGTVRTHFTREAFYCSQNVIDLEELDERMSNESANCKTVSKNQHKFQGSAFLDPIISNSLREDPSPEMAESSSFLENSECCQEQTSASTGVKEALKNVSSAALFSEVVYQGGQLDLNKAHHDHSSCCSDDRMLPYPSRASSDGASDEFAGDMVDETCQNAFNRCSDKASDMLKKDNLVNYAHLDLNRKSTSTDICTSNPNNYGISGSEPSPVSSESVVRHPVTDSVDPSFHSGNNRSDSVELKSKLSSEGCEKSSIENLILQGKSPASRKSSCISDNDSSSAKMANSSITYDVVNQSLKPQLETQAVDVSTEEQQKPTFDANEEEPLDVVIQEAAELLIHISSRPSACNQEKIEIERTPQPLCSFDSFELIAINLTESNAGDDSVSSKPNFEITDTSAKEFGLKLRRGRRMKDFQREILPNLASLSRHEILEDINIMEGVLRSREYRKMRAKSAVHGSKWPAPVRSRRSRHSFGGRRNFS